MTDTGTATVDFTWTPERLPGDGGRLFDSLKNDEGDYVCPWPNCGHISPGSAPQGIGRHMSAAHGWQGQRGQVRNPVPGHSSKEGIAASRKKPVKVRCIVQKDGHACGRMIRRDYLRQHLKQYHGLADADLPEAMAAVNRAMESQKPPKREPSPLAARKAKSPPLSAEEICQAVLTEVSPNGSIPINMIGHYQTWVAQTGEFLTLLLG